MMLSVDKLTCVNDFISGVKPNNSISVCKTISLEKSKSLLLYFSDDTCIIITSAKKCINLHDIIIYMYLNFVQLVVIYVANISQFILLIENWI